MLGDVNWSRQFLILGFAAMMSLYWTSKSGLWSALGGKTSLEKDWQTANQVLRKKLGMRYEIVEISNQRDEKRTLVLSSRVAGAPQLIMAEMFPVIKPRVKEPKKQKRMRGQDRWKQDEKDRKKKREYRTNKYKSYKRGKFVEEVEKDAVARLKIWHESLQSVRDFFMDSEGVKRPESLIEVWGNTTEPGGQQEEENPPRNIPTNPLPKEILPSRPPPQVKPSDSSILAASSHGEVKTTTFGSDEEVNLAKEAYNGNGGSHGHAHGKARGRDHEHNHGHARGHAHGHDHGHAHGHRETEL